MAQNGTEWHRMVQNGTEWRPKGTEWLRMLQNSPEKNVQKAQNGTE